ncbi:hypothetical protein BSZ39_04825 [Bowdeniella nasicola]|uniref:ABC transmembrane type-1 domain-containing protein n=1 Tax=Bowdeniella nasicola TaxID=208480 RepID=A0A1Q5Q3M2_9ACTO|nr:ABC transporter permease [Bowdeniella nasicola]OKL54292.1 hypothetical protein BSZ39_04825 [Bowdeniella nasicola]
MAIAITRRRRVFAPAIFALLMLLAWHLASQAANPFVLPSPLAVARRLIAELTGAELWPYLFATLQAALGGAALGAAAGIPLGYLMATSKLVRRSIAPWVAASQAIPAIALAPLLVMWAGYGTTPTIILCALMVFFPIVLTTHLGVRDLDPDIIDAARLDGAAGATMVRYVQAPLASPAILTGLRGGLTLSITGAIVGEFVMGGRGLGLLLTVYRDSVDTEGLFAVLIILCSLAALLYAGMSAIERYLRGLW